MEAQGYHVKDTIVYQDNQSAILLERNGTSSSGRRTRHIDIRYYFATDRIKDGELRVAYCPTEEMIADFFTKPLQGSLFRKFRSLILNLKDDRWAGQLPSAQECVGVSYIDTPGSGRPPGSANADDTLAMDQIGAGGARSIESSNSGKETYGVNTVTTV